MCVCMCVRFDKKRWKEADFEGESDGSQPH